jgi:acyl dehydratase
MSDSYSPLFDVWSRASTRALENYMAANRAAMAAMGVPTEGETDPVSALENGHGDSPAPPETAVTADATLPGWEVDLDASEEGLSVGDSVRFSKTLTDGDVEQFAAISGDTNPLHLDDDAASETRFGGRIVHGALVTGLISAALARLPGTVVYLSQDTEFRAPVRIGDRVTADVGAVEDLGGNRFRLRTQVLRDDDPVIDGEAVVLIE